MDPVGAAASGRLWLTAAAAFAAALLVAEVVRRNAGRWRLIDRPGPRSSHASPTPLGGGVGVLAGILLGSAVLALVGRPLGSGGIALLLGAALLGVVGLLDDVRYISPWPRLILQASAAIFVVSRLGGLDRVPLPPPLDAPLGFAGAALSVVWIVGVANFFNFMDGIDGLAGAQAAATGTCVLAVGWSNDADGLAAVIVGSAAGFLVLNWPPARIFLGDAGSVPLGFLLAALPLSAPAERRTDAVLATAISLALFLLDPLETLLRRWRRGEQLTRAHRSHSYQRLLASGQEHGRVTLALAGGAIVLSALAAVSFARPALRWPALAAALALFAVEAVVAKRSHARHPSH
ncbi:MAG: glycosyl transferase [Thermoanaerobaculia bacterium]